jgi:CRISPR-associated endonuclease/helicase Cas3
VFEPEAGGLPRGAYRTGTDTARVLLNTPGFDFHDPAWYERYFQRLYQARDLDELGIQPLRWSLDYPEVAARFRLIADDTVPVIVLYRGWGGSDRTVDALVRAVRAAVDVPHIVFRRLQPFLVQVWRREIAAHLQTGRCMEVRPGLWQWVAGYDALRGLTNGLRDAGDLVL